MTPEVRDRIEQLRHGVVPEGYKKTRSGIVPIDWTETCLGDIYTERKEPGNENLPLLMVSIHSGVSDGEVDEDDLPKKVKRIEDKSQYKRAAKGDLVFNMMRAWQGAIGTVRTEGMVSPAYIVAEPSDKVDPLFMDYYMKTNRMVQTIRRQSYGVTDFRLRLYWDSFAPIQCTLPSVEEQKKIAEILTAQDKVIELEQQRIEEIRKAKEYFLEKMFPKKNQVVPEIRFADFSNDWEQRKLGDYVQIASGEAPSKFKEGSLNYVKVDDLNYAYKTVIDTQNKVEHHPSVSKVKKGSVIFPKRGAAILTNKVRILGVDAYIDTNMMALSALEIDAEFLYVLISKEGLYKIADTSTIPQINNKHIEPYKVLITQLREQRSIGQFFSEIDNLIILYQRKLAEEKKKKELLMQLLLTGIVRVSV